MTATNFKYPFLILHSDWIDYPLEYFNFKEFELPLYSKVVTVYCHSTTIVHYLIIF